MAERILITGASGCLGKACVAWLRQAGPIELLSLTRSPPSSSSEPIEHVAGDITQADAVASIVSKFRPTRIIHLAAWQSPDCQARPLQGMAVNVDGTHHLLRAALSLKGHLQRFVFASSAAVYGPRDDYHTATVREDQGLRPPNLYGHWKVAGEGATQAFHLETGVPAVSLRLATTYGPGRDRGLTSAVTGAMRAIVAGQRFAMPYAGREHYHFSSDVGAAFGIAALDPWEGYGAFNLRGESMATRDFVALIQQVAHQEGLARGQIEMAADLPPLPFVCDLDDVAVRRQFPRMPCTPLTDGIRQSLRQFAAQIGTTEETTSKQGNTSTNP